MVLIIGCDGGGDGDAGDDVGGNGDDSDGDNETGGSGNSNE